MCQRYRWDPQEYRNSSSNQRTWAVELLSKIDLSGSETVLDIGCGDGEITALIAARVPPTMYQAVLAEWDVDRQLQGEGGKNQDNRIAGLPNDVRATIQLRDTMFEIAAKCLSNPSYPREYHLVLYLSCLGALKYRNLEQNQKHLLYLTAASLVKTLTRR